MAEPLTYLQQRAEDDWLVGYDSQAWFKLVQQSRHDLQGRSPLSSAQVLPHPPLKILLAEPDPLQFLAHFIAACTTPHHIFLCNPHWQATEWQQVFDLVQPDLCLGNCPSAPDVESQVSRLPRLTSLFSPASLSSPSPLAPLILIPTGGSSGGIRFTIHTWDTLMASAQGFRQYFEIEQVNSLCVLPLHHVSGLMQFLRSFASGGKLAIFPFKSLEAGNLPQIDPTEFFLSLVPTQLQRLLHSPLPFPGAGQAQGTASTVPHSLYSLPPLLSLWLSQFQAVLLGGAPAWFELLQQARKVRIRLAPTYGMTETASQIVTLKPEDFLQGQTGCGQVLPHAQVAICSETGEVLGAHQTGRVTIQAKSLALGYYPEIFDQTSPASLGEACPQDVGGLGGSSSSTASAQPLCKKKGKYFHTDDLGYLDSQGYLYLLGRNSGKIITGGENVFPAEVEAAIRATGFVADVCVLGVDDRRWGQAVTAIYVPNSPDSSETAIAQALATTLTKYKHPKHWIAVEQLPRNAQGKLNQEKLKHLVHRKIGSSIQAEG